jgi:hypothetical protein
MDRLARHCRHEVRQRAENLARDQVVQRNLLCRDLLPQPAGQGRLLGPVPAGDLDDRLSVAGGLGEDSVAGLAQDGR